MDVPSFIPASSEPSELIWTIPDERDNRLIHGVAFTSSLVTTARLTGQYTWTAFAGTVRL
jgi:hypothetical protein